MHIYTAGLADVHTREPMQAGLRFRVGSISKTVVATLVLKLVSEGRLRLSDTVARWLPGLLAAGEPITVTELLQHRSGLPDYLLTGRLGLPSSRSAIKRVWKARQLVGVIARRPLLFAPGTQFNYSNTNYLVLGLLIERVTQMPVERYAERTIFAPQRMRSTSFALGRVPGAHAHGYTSFGPFPVVAGGLRDVDALNGSEYAAAASLVSTAADLDRLFTALFSGRIIPRGLLTLMQATRPAQEGLGFDGYGLGLEATRTRCGTAFGHGGLVWGYRAIVRASRTADHLIVLLVNYDYQEAEHDAAVKTGVALYCAT